MRLGISKQAPSLRQSRPTGVSIRGPTHSYSPGACERGVSDAGLGCECRRSAMPGSWKESVWTVARGVVCLAVGDHRLVIIALALTDLGVLLGRLFGLLGLLGLGLLLRALAFEGSHGRVEDVHGSLGGG